MKWRAIVCVVFLLVPDWTDAQSSIGVKGGLNISNIQPGSFSNQRLRTGFHAGLLWHIHLGQSLAFQPELVYSLQGVKLSGNERLNLSYINVPFLLQVMVGRGFRLEAGPQLGFLVNAREQTGSTLENVRPSYKTLDAALAVGFGFIGNAGLGFDVRYNYGLSDINKSGGDDVNQVFQVGLFYQFRH
jgi:hypothetical protein